MSVFWYAANGCWIVPVLVSHDLFVVYNNILVDVEKQVLEFRVVRED